MSDLRTTAAWRALQAQRLQRLHPQQPAPLTAGEVLALLEDVQLAEQALADSMHETTVLRSAIVDALRIPYDRVLPDDKVLVQALADCQRALAGVSEIVEVCGPRPIGGQQVTPPPYNMTPYTRKELKRIIDATLTPGAPR